MMGMMDMDEKPISNSDNIVDNAKNFQATPKSFKQILQTLLIICAVVALGLYIINAVIDYRYKVEFLKTPCGLCAELNKEQSQCINGCFSFKVNLFPDGKGGWCGEDGFKYIGTKKTNETCQRSNESLKQEVNVTALFEGLAR